MLKSRFDLEKYLEIKKRELNNKRKKQVTALAVKAYERFKIPTGEFIDMVAGRVELSAVSDFHLFCFTYMMDLLEDTLIHQDYFTDKEINLYLQVQVQDELNDFFPIIFDCTQTAPDQWVGSTNVSFFMKLRKLQLIRYNPETQRSMNKVVHGEKEVFKISINKAAAEQIADSYINETYIPDTITLNILPDSVADFYFDAKNRQLIINSISHFDMIDGFHRFFAMGFVEDKRKDFEYPMELRITNFNSTKAKQFIWQQDQKTKMRKIDSDSMNMNNAAVVLLEALNQDVTSPLMGMLKRNGGQINIGEMARIVDWYYFKDIPVNKHRSQSIIVKKTINNIFNRLFEYDVEFAEKSYSFSDLLFLINAFEKYNKLETSEIVYIYNEGRRNKSIGLKRSLTSMKPGKVLIGKIDKLMEVAYEQCKCKK